MARQRSIPRVARERLRPSQVLRWLTAVRPSTVRAAIWTQRACRAINRSPSVLQRPSLPPVPSVPGAAGRGVDHVLWLRGEQCLVRAYVRQSWLAAHGDPRELVIGSTGVDGFAAHAWLSGEEWEGDGYHELVRLPPPA